MKQARKVLYIIGVGIIGVFLTVSTVYACCGVNPYITDDPIEPGCPGDEVAISGVIKGLEEWYDAYSTGPVEMTIEVSSPSGDVTSPQVTLSNLQEYKPPGQNIGRYATWDFSATYTPPEAGTYVYTKTVSWESALGWVMTQTASGTFEVEDCEVVELDIKPGSCPNPFNAKSKGNVSVAILGSAEVDVTTIDPASIRLEGVAPLKWSIEDVSQPGGYDPEDCFDCFEEPDPITLPDGTVVEYSGDGIPDLVMQFDTQALAAVIAAMGAARDDCVVLTLTGVLKDGTPIQPASDSVIIRTK